MGGDIKPNKSRGRVYKDRQHLPFPDPDRRGQEGRELIETNAIPMFLARTGDCIITPKTLEMGEDNNTMIVMGRDRNGLGELAKIGKTDALNGFGHHMGAGAIDIVVGRMSPFPLASLKNDPRNSPLYVGPAHRTKVYPEGHALRQVQISNFEESISEEGQITSEAVGDGTHPGVVMDAARIYISQMTLLDDYFDISKDIITSPGVQADEGKSSIPHSGIMIKADEVRMHARKDIKIVTGGLNEKFDSQGNSLDIMKDTGKIHLVAGNGMRQQHPVVLGNNLVNLINDMIKSLEDVISNVDSFYKEQMKFNMHVMQHVHTEVGATGMSTLPSLTTMKYGSETMLKHLSNNVINGTMALGVGLTALKAYINPASKNDKYINSRNVTTS